MSEKPQALDSPNQPGVWAWRKLSGSRGVELLNISLQTKHTELGTQWIFLGPFPVFPDALSDLEKRALDIIKLIEAKSGCQLLELVQAVAPLL